MKNMLWPPHIPQSGSVTCVAGPDGSTAWVHDYAAAAVMYHCADHSSCVDEARKMAMGEPYNHQIVNDCLSSIAATPSWEGLFAEYACDVRLPYGSMRRLALNGELRPGFTTDHILAIKYMNPRAFQVVGELTTIWNTAWSKARDLLGNDNPTADDAYNAALALGMDERVAAAMFVVNDMTIEAAEIVNMASKRAANRLVSGMPDSPSPSSPNLLASPTSQPWWWPAPEVNDKGSVIPTTNKDDQDIAAFRSVARGAFLWLASLFNPVPQGPGLPGSAPAFRPPTGAFSFMSVDELLDGERRNQQKQQELF